MSTVNEAMIVAGGAGTRLWPLTAHRPKPLVPFCGPPFLTGVLRRLAAVGVRRVLLVVGDDPAPFEVLREDARAVGVQLEAVPEPEPLDTAGGVRGALDRVSGTFLVLNGDILTDVDLAGPITAHRDAGAAATLVLTRVVDTSSFGVCVLDGSRITGFVEKPPPGTLPDQDTVNAGTYVLEPSALASFPVGPLSFERRVFPGLVADGHHVEGFVSEAPWADLGTPSRYLDGHVLALDGSLRWPPLEDLPADAAGVRRSSSATVAPDAVLRGPLVVAEDVVVEAGATVGPHVVLGAGSRVGAGARLRRCVVGPDGRIGSGAALAGVVTGHRAVVGAGVRALEGAVLGDDVEVAADRVLPAGATVPARP